MKQIMTITIAVLLLFSTSGVAAFAEADDEIVISTYTANPFTPGGTGTVVDRATGEDGKEFYTITTSDENVFYLIIDRQRNTENVYFLNAVTARDLISLAKLPESDFPSGVFEPTPPEPESVMPPPEPEQKKSQDDMTKYIIIAVFSLLAFATAWYIKIRRPKQNTVIAEEYEPVYEDDDTPPWEYTESENRNE